MADRAVVTSTLLSLRQSWAQLLPGQVGLGAELLSRWSEPHRRYHDTTHLAAALAALAELGGASRAEQLAIWFHDSVHTGRPGRDERNSAALAKHALGESGLAGAEVEEVVRLVLVTIDHSPALGDWSGARVSDADLAVLGASPESYSASVAGLRAEAGNPPEEVWRRIRLAQIAGLLAREPLFYTPVAKDRWLPHARSNLAAEQRQLRAPDRL